MTIRQGASGGRPRVAVVGGGVAGMTAASELARARARVDVYEAQGVLGGRFSPRGETEFEMGGRAHRFPLEHGLHAVWPRYTNFIALVERYGLGERLVQCDRSEMIFRTGAGRRVMMEISASVRESKLPDALAPLSMLISRSPIENPGAFLPGLPRALRSLSRAVVFDPARDALRWDDQSVGAWIEGWPPALRELFGAMARCGFFMEPDEVGLAPFLASLSFYALADRDACAYRVFDAEGGAALLEPMAAEVRAGGGAVHLDRPVRELMAAAEGGHAIVTDAGAEVYDAVVFALDPPGARAVLGDRLARWGAPDAVSSTVVRLWFPRPPGELAVDTGMFGHGDGDNFFWIHRLMGDYRRWHEATGGGVLEVHLYGQAARVADRSPEAEILDHVEAKVRGVWPDLGPRLHGAAVRNPPTHTAFRPGVLSRLPPMDALGPRLYLAGDWIGCPRPVFYLERAATTALLAAHRAAADLGLHRGRLQPVSAPRAEAPSVRLMRQLLRMSGVHRS